MTNKSKQISLENKRNHVVVTKVTQGEYSKICSAAKSCNMTVSTTNSVLVHGWQGVHGRRLHSHLPIQFLDRIFYKGKEMRIVDLRCSTGQLEHLSGRAV